MINKIFIHITYECNAKCIHCAVPKFKGMLSLKDFRKIVDVSKEEGVEYIILGGGEPLVHPDVMEMINYADAAGIKTKIETNGKLLNKVLLDRLKDNIFQINISLDGASSQTHDSIRHLNTFQNTIEAITYARKLGIDVAIWGVVMKSNIKDLNQMVDILESVDVKKISFLYATPVGACFSNRENILVDINEYYSFMKGLYAKNKDLQIRIAPYLIPFDKAEDFSNNYTLAITNAGCMIYDKEIIHIDPKGNIFPCVLLLSNDKYILGTITHDDDLKNVLRCDNKYWDKIVLMLDAQKKHAQNSDAGCIGLCESFNTDVDPRISYGVPVCPCRTVRKEWIY